MKPRRIFSAARLSFPLATALAALLATSNSRAGQTWDGGGGDNNWNTTNNWDLNVLATFTSPINFQGNTRNTAVNNLTADTTVIGGINFVNNGTTINSDNISRVNAFTLSGNRITLGGNITTTANLTGSTITDTISLAMILNGNRTITTNQFSSTLRHNLTVSGIISQDGTNRSLTKAGNGILTLTAANSYLGATIINAGILNLGGGTATGSLDSTTLTLGGGSLNYTRTGTNAQSFTSTSISGASMITGTSTNTLNLGTVSRGTNNSFYDFGTTGLSLVSALAASNDATGIMGGFTVGDTWAVANGTGVAISGLANGSYTQSSAALNAAASYTGLNIDVDSSQTPDAAITANSLRFSGAAANTLTLQGTNTITSGGILVGSAVGSNLSTITGGTLTGVASKDLAIIQNNTSGGLTISSIIANTTLTSLTKSGAGLITLDASNTFTGGLTINGGKVLLNNAGALNSTTPNNVTFGTGASGTLTLNGNNLTIPTLNTNATTPGSSIIENANAGNATLTIGNASNTSSSFAGVIQNGTGVGTLALTKAGTGTLTLSGASTYSGGTALTAGTLVISNATSLGAGAVTVTGTTARINAAGGITYGNNIAVNGPLTMQNNTAITASSTATFSGVLSGSGAITLPNVGYNGIQGIIAFTNPANSFTGNVILSPSSAGDEFFSFASLGDGGTFSFAKNGNRQGVIYTGSNNITFNTRTITIATTMVNGGATDRQGLDGGGANPVSMFANDGTGTVTFGSGSNMVVNNITSNYGVLYFGGTNAGDNTFGGNIGDTSGASQLSIGKFGSGKWIFTGSNT